MRGINRFPLGNGISRPAVSDLRSGGTKISAEIIDHLAQRAELIEKLGAFAKRTRHSMPLTRAARWPLAPWKLAASSGAAFGTVP